MRWILDEVQDFAKQVDAMQEVVHAQVKAIPVPEGYSLEVNSGKGDLE